MKRAIVWCKILFVSLLTTVACASGTFGGTLSGQGYETVRFRPRDLGGMVVAFNIILPHGYAGSGKRYPVLYLLHGVDGGENRYMEWVTHTHVVRDAAQYDEIIVMPEADRSWYTNSRTNSKLAWEDYLVLDLIPYVDSHYRTVPSRSGRAIAGMSMGGYGAMKLALKHPQLFSAVASLSGALSHAHWSDGEPLPPFWSSSNDVFKLAKTLSPQHSLQIYISVGEEDPFLQVNRQFVALLSRLKVPYLYREFPGGHVYTVWDKELPVVLAIQAAVIGSK